MGIDIIGASSGSQNANDVGFVINVGSSIHYTTSFETAFPAGAYSISISQSDSTWDIYGVGANNVFAGYTSGSKVTFTVPVEKIVIFGSVANQIYTFAYDGPAEAPETSGDVVGAAAYITATSVSQLQNLNSTTTITGGNFASDVQVWFDAAGQASVQAKAVVRNSSTSIVATRPDSIAYLPTIWSIRVVNPGVPLPTITNAHILSNSINFGVNVPTSPVEYSVIGSGGGGGRSGGGGGGGKVTNGSFTPTLGQTYTISCAAGGAGATSESASGGVGSTTNFVLPNTTASAAGGGGGGSINTAASSAAGGGGGGGMNWNNGTGNARGNSNAGSGRGGDAYHLGQNSAGASGGGGGAVGAGGDAISSNGNAGAGGTGALTVSGESWGGGGGGGSTNGRNTGAGIHGGGNGANGWYAAGGGGQMGGGGGGGSLYAPNVHTGNGGTGGNGAVILKYSDQFSTITNIGVGLTYTLENSGGFRIYKFTAGTGTISW